MKTIFTLFLFSFHFDVAFKHQRNENTSTYIQYSIKNPCSDLYRIRKIKRLRNLFIIYAERNDSIFKIVSLQENHSKCEFLIKKNKCYKLKLHSRFEHPFLGHDFPVSNRLLVTHYDYYGTLVSVEDKSRRDLYTAENLKGLCLDE